MDSVSSIRGQSLDVLVSFETKKYQQNIQYVDITSLFDHFTTQTISFCYCLLLVLKQVLIIPLKTHLRTTWCSDSLTHWGLVRNRSLRWRHNDSDGVSNHQPHDCLLNRLFGRISKKTSKLRVTGLCVGNSQGPVNSPHKGPVTRKMFPFDDVIMWIFTLNHH